MFIPSSVWDQSRELTYGVFELIEANTILEMMQDVFTQRVGVQNSYFLEPLTYNMHFSLRSDFQAKRDNYKYKISIAIDKLTFNLFPDTLTDLLSFRQFLEGQSYVRDLQKFRPLLRIQTFIDLRDQLRKQGKHLSPQ